jgi:transposase InsO family protein
MGLRGDLIFRLRGAPVGWRPREWQGSVSTPKKQTFKSREFYLVLEAILDAYLFTDIREVRALTKEWMEEYNQGRPHEALHNQTPSEGKQQILSLLVLFFENHE